MLDKVGPGDPAFQLDHVRAALVHQAPRIVERLVGDS